jgi:murein DD-endopeptidase MepM/ murein hydrolase activator NlpD
MKFTTCLLLFTASLFAQPQSQFPKDYFRSPLDIPLMLAGNFGELRNNHFHAGFDIRTQQKEGFNVYASADGYVSRIKISTYGYGKAIYITHPNGFTTVYGHLQKGYGKIEDYIKANQYKTESYDLEVFPKPDELPVKKGELIAISGNTGGSEGPHLHFEFRDSKTEFIINPLYFGFGNLIPDTKKPVITSVMAYPLDENSVVNNSTIPVNINLTKQGDGTFIAEKVLAKGKIGFGIIGYDSDNNSNNPNGIFETASYLNGNLSFDYKFDSFHFDQTRFVNAFIDYPRYKRSSQRVQKLFMKNKYPLVILHTDDNNGIVNMTPNVDGTYRIESSDFAGNKSTVTIPIAYSPQPANMVTEMVKTPYFIDVTKDYNFEQDNVSVFFPAGTFYEDFYLDFAGKDKKLSLNNKYVAVHSNFMVTIKDNSAPESDREKTFIANTDGGKLSYNDTYYKDGAFNAKVRSLGQFELAKDTTAPVISVAKSIEGKWLSKQKTLVVYIRDNISGIKDYKGYLNGKFILFEYDYKTRKLTHHFDDNIFADGRNDLKVIVSDNVGNSAIFETYFFKSKN